MPTKKPAPGARSKANAATKRATAINKPVEPTKKYAPLEPMKPVKKAAKKVVTTAPTKTKNK